MLRVAPFCVTINIEKGEKLCSRNTIKALRKEHGLTQTELGKVVGFTHVAVVKWENGQREPDFSTLMKLADYFGVSTDYLLGREVNCQTKCNRI